MFYVEDRIVDSHIKNLRKKLNVDYIETIRGWDIELINAIKNKLSAKVFLITFVLLVLACGRTFLCVLKIMPSSYLDTLNRNAEAQSLELLDTLSTYDNLDKCIKAICDFEIQTGSTVWLDDEYGNTLYPSNVTTEQDMVAAESYVTLTVAIHRMRM